MKNAIIIITSLAMACHSTPSKSEKDSLAAGSNDSANTRSGLVELPPPYKTESVRNSSDVIGWENNATPVAPSGFTVTKYAGDLEGPRWIYVLPNGDVLIAESNKGRIQLLRDKDGDGTPEQKTVFLSDLDMPFGMLLLNNNFYVANQNAVMRFPYTKDATTITADGQKILDIPGGGRHWTRNIVANKNGTKIYVSVGSASDHAEDGIEKENRRTCILEINPDGSGERLYASGLRNPVGMDWAPGTSTLWTAVNERDELGDELVPDYATSVKDGGFYGWPYSYFGQNEDPRIEAKDKRPDLVKRAIVPDVPLGSHTASLGLAFYTGKSFPEKYHNGMFIGQHGSWNSSVLVGYKVVFVPFNNGKPGKPEDFLTGFIADQNKSKVYGRPVGVAVLPDGSLLVADDAGGTIWRVTSGK
jgi:glucose/arabinose dehydrogenase